MHLWLKLYKTGIGGKILQSVKDMYYNVKSCVRSCSTYSDFFPFLGWATPRGGHVPFALISVSRGLRDVFTT